MLCEAGLARLSGRLSKRAAYAGGAPLLQSHLSREVMHVDARDARDVAATALLFAADRRMERGAVSCSHFLRAFTRALSTSA